MRRIGFILFTVVVLATLVKLGLWQMSRAQEKQALSSALKYRSEQMYYSLDSLPSDPRWYGLTLRGAFDHSRAVLLDNQTYQGRVGYHVLYPFAADGAWVLVNLGWIAAPAYREQIPVLPEHHGELRLAGVIAPPSGLIELKQAPLVAEWPLRVQNLNIQKLSEKMELALLPWVLQIDPEHPVALQQTWTPVVTGPHKHYAYALQWFLMAAAIFALAGWWLKRSKL
ncbi:Cytochrome oxidase biogenesis protein Surf1, facilitates heme A insertion [Photobacterium marinum]|uniref:SURF1-like protein n=1 Tax=Photobacterium marinum TaxID=1056511 RepID=L8J5J9_9GAMM|nr:SURF1 family protein [Photobacterium marinum]ELR64041.1 Cytochrome oxidase biogenesis protein Surf1, facilitates heme A insertion [Photobacterium marinum]